MGNSTLTNSQAAQLAELTPEERDELDALREMPDNEINLTEMPVVQEWSDARRGQFYRPIKHQLTIRLDADLVAWFRDHATKARGYQTGINAALREYVSAQEAGDRKYLSGCSSTLDSGDAG